MNQKNIKVVVASKNPVKVAAALGGFQKMWPEAEVTTLPLSVPSGVAEQPMSDIETLTGARNRAQRARTEQPLADFWIGLEGGVEEIHDGLAAFAWIVVLSNSHMGQAKTGAFFLPPTVATLVRQGVELGDADDQVFGHSNSKQKGGAIGLLTKDVLDRKQLYEQAVVLALVPFKNEELYRH